MTPNIFALIRKIASVVLMICFVLPLSRCTLYKGYQGHVIGNNIYVFGFDIAKDGWTALTTGDMVTGLLLLVAILVFFVPLLCLRLDERRQALIHVFGMPISEFFLFYWVLVFSNSPQVGGVLAMLCWAALFSIGCATLLRRWRSCKE